MHTHKDWTNQLEFIRIVMTTCRLIQKSSSLHSIWQVLYQHWNFDYINMKNSSGLLYWVKTWMPLKSRLLAIGLLYLCMRLEDWMGEKVEAKRNKDRQKHHMCVGKNICESMYLFHYLLCTFKKRFEIYFLSKLKNKHVSWWSGKNHSEWINRGNNVKLFKWRVSHTLRGKQT